MTPIQEHQDELIGIAIRAGFEVDRDCLPHAIHATTDTYMLSVTSVEGWFVTCYAGIGNRAGEFQKRGVYHPDPRVALRTCLEMAGVLKDHPPLTPDDLEAWLRANHSPPLNDSSVPTWLVRGRRLERFGDEWCYRGTMVPARDIGVMVWADRRWPQGVEP